MNEEMNINSFSFNNPFLTTTACKDIIWYNTDTVSIKNTFEDDIKDLKKRNAELQTMVHNLIVKDRKRQEEFEEIINMIKTNIQKK
jgi:flavodoxin